MTVDELVTHYRTWGLTKALHYWLMEALKRWLFLCVVDLRPLNAKPKLPSLPAGRSVHVATRPELERLTDESIYEIRRSFIDAALARGAFCVAAFQDDKIIAYVWRSFCATPHVAGLWVDFGRKYRYGYKAFTHPDFRREGLQHAIAFVADAEAIRQGYTHAIGFAETHNFASLISDAKRGHERVGYAGYLRFRGRVFPFRTPGAKRHGFRFFVPPTRRCADH